MSDENERSVASAGSVSVMEVTNDDDLCLQRLRAQGV